jgi:hypothetical protein
VRLGLPNFLTINGKANPATDAVKMKVGQTIKLRCAPTTISFIHARAWREVVALDGETLAPSARYFADAVLLAGRSASRRRASTWLHCAQVADNQHDHQSKHPLTKYAPMESP